MRIVTLLTLAAVSTCRAATVAAEPVVVIGTGDPGRDVSAVQAAVDRGGQVVLMGHFSFEQSPTKPAGATHSRMVTVSKEVSLSGQDDGKGDPATIQGGFVPFYVEAQGRRFAIRGVRFVRPKAAAVWVRAAHGLMIADCRIEGVEPAAEFSRYAGIARPVASAFFVGFNPTPPKADQEEHPEYNSGMLSIFDNDIDVGGTAGDQTLGITIFGVGKSPDQEVDVYIFQNKVRNITERAINTNFIGGRVHIERNVITTGATMGPSNGVQPDAIHAVGAGSYLIAHNVIVCEWAAGAGIRVQGSLWSPEVDGLVAYNDVTMSAPKGAIFGANSAGIDIRGSANANAVVNNRIRGRARAALAVTGQRGGLPRDNTFVSNDLQGFQPALTEVFVDGSETNTTIVRRKAHEKQ